MKRKIQKSADIDTITYEDALYFLNSLPEWRLGQLYHEYNTRDNEFLAAVIDVEELYKLGYTGPVMNIDVDVTCSTADDSDEGHYEDLPQAEQEYDSAKTSINSKQLPAIYKLVSLPEGSTGIDYGGGKFDNAVEALAEKDITLYVYDPYNRTAEHNRSALKALRQNGGADFAICSNVLNVIKEREARINVLQNIKKITKTGAPVYITVYEGTGEGNEGATKSGYQLNRKTEGYLDEIKEVFPDAKRKGKLISATNSRTAIENSTRVQGSSSYDNIITVRREKHDFIVRYSGDRDYNLKCQIHRVTPYDDANYTWARYDHFKAEYIRDRKVIDTSYMACYDDGEYEQFSEYCDDVVYTIIDNLIELDKNVEPRMVHNSTAITSNSKIDKWSPEDVHQEVSRKLTEILERKGWERSDIRDMTRVDAYFSDRSKSHLVIEVGAEVTYSDLEEIGYELNKVVSEYDPDCYFEPEQPGITICYMSTANADIDACSNISDDTPDEDEYVAGSRYYIPNRDLDPPEDDDYEEETDDTSVEIDVDAIITLDEDGIYEYDTGYAFAECPYTRDKEWYSDNYDVNIGDSTYIVECLDELLIDRLPDEPGSYHITGSAELFFNVENIQVKREYFWDERHGSDYDEEAYTDSAEVYFNRAGSALNISSLNKL